MQETWRSLTADHAVGVETTRADTAGHGRHSGLTGYYL
jgi:hypothetical protein